MRETKPGLTSELEAHRNGAPIWKAPAFEVGHFRTLVEHVARLAYANPDELLFFRGQDKDYQSKAGGTTLYLAIYEAIRWQGANCGIGSISSTRLREFSWTDSESPGSTAIKNSARSATSNGAFFSIMKWSQRLYSTLRSHFGWPVPSLR